MELLVVVGESEVENVGWNFSSWSWESEVENVGWNFSSWSCAAVPPALLFHESQRSRSFGFWFGLADPSVIRKANAVH